MNPVRLAQRKADKQRRCYSSLERSATEERERIARGLPRTKDAAWWAEFGEQFQRVRLAEREIAIAIENVRKSNQ